MAKASTFSANKACQPVYQAIHTAIEHLTPEQAKEGLEELAGNCEAQIEAINEETGD